MIFTFNSVFNILVLLGAAYRFFMIYVVLKRVDARQRSSAFSAMICPLAGTIIWALSVLLPLMHYRTFDTSLNQALFWSGFAIWYVPDLILWWKKRSAGTT